MADSTDKIFSTPPSNLQVEFNASSTAAEAAASTSQGTLYATPHGLYLNKTLIAQDTFSSFKAQGKSSTYSDVNGAVAASTNQDQLTLEFGDGLLVGTDDAADHIKVDLKNAGVPLINTAIDSNNYLNGSLDVHPVVGQYYLVYVDAAKKASSGGYSMKLTFGGGTVAYLFAVTQNGTTTGVSVNITPGIHIAKFTAFDSSKTTSATTESCGTIDFLDSWQVVKAAAATTADQLSTSAGSATQPVYFKDGKPVATTYTLGKSVPANAVFTDTNTTYSAGTGISLSGTTFSNSGVRSVATGGTNGTISVNTNGTAADVAVKGLAAAAYKGVDTSVTSGSANLVTSGAVSSAISGFVSSSAVGQKSGIASLDSDGKVPSTQLPSYVDDVLEYEKLASFPTTGETGKIYVALDSNKCYRWSGTTYIEISATEVPAATASILGGIKTGYTTSGKNYKVQVDASNNAYVNVPWTDTNTDTKVTAVGNHYAPAADSSAALSVDASGGAVTNVTGAAATTSVVTGVNIQRDAKGHVTGITVDSKGIYSTDTNTIPAAYCATAAGTAAKVASFTGYALRTNNIFPIVFTTANTVQSALTLNVNGTGAKNLIINDAVTSATNFTLPAGTYICFYNGTQYLIRTDGKLPIGISVRLADYASNLTYARTINGTPFNGSANITTANWGTARNISISDSSAANTGTAVSVNGSANVTLKLPATIKATLNGNATSATTATTATTATKLGSLTEATVKTTLYWQ